MKKLRSSPICLLICMVLLMMSFCLPSSRAEEVADSRIVQGITDSFGYIITWDYLYSDAFFSLPSDQYHHDFARLSFGLTAAAFRDGRNPEHQDDYLLDFWDKMGFSDPETEVYRTAPTADSICYGLARKTIGDMTVIACAVCGGNYGAEWASNLTVGDEARPIGFQDASQKVQAALADYLERYPAEGKVKLWITGYSRAAAVANLTAADCTASGQFEDVYAYTFATPLTTREPIAYPNIFNILQKEDVVPKIPLEDWGYRRYGTDLFIVSSETDADCTPLLNKAAALFRQMTGAEMVFNTEINYEIRTVLDYLRVLMPDSATYAEHLQPVLVDIMTGDEETEDALKVLLTALNRYSTDDPAVGQELKELRDYLGTLISLQYLQGKVDQLPADQWDPQMGILNLFNAHAPAEYLALLYATDDPAVLYSDNTDYIRLIIYGDADVTIADGDAVLKQILADGTQWVDGAENAHAFPEVQTSNEKVMITLPADHSYTVTVESKSTLPQTITYTGLRASGHTVKAVTDHVYSYLLNKGDQAIIQTSTEKDRVIEPEKSDHTDISILTETIYSPTTAMRMESNLVVHLTISGLVNRLLLLIVILLVMAIVAIILAIIRKKKHREKNPVVAFIWYGIMVFLFALLEVALWFFIPVLPLAKIIPGILVFIVLLIYAFRGCHSISKRWKFFWILMLVLVAYMVFECFLNGDFTLAKGIILLVVNIGFLTAAFIRLWHRKKAEETESEAAN